MLALWLVRLYQLLFQGKWRYYTGFSVAMVDRNVVNLRDLERGSAQLTSEPHIVSLW